MVQDKTTAQNLNEALPTYDELCGHELLSRIIGIGMFSPSSREKIATAVNQMMFTMMGKGWFTGYDLDTDTATVLDHAGGEYTVTIEEFDAMTKFCFMTWLEMPVSDKAYDLYLDFKCDPKIWKILD